MYARGARNKATLPVLIKDPSNPSVSFLPHVATVDNIAYYSGIVEDLECVNTVMLTTVLLMTSARDRNLAPEHHPFKCAHHRNVCSSP